MISERTMRRAYACKDPEYDGIFFVGVRSTGIFCRPVCRSRAPLPENMEFFRNIEQALYGGYRPCKRCRPLDAGHTPPPLVARLLVAVDRADGARLRDKDLRALGVDPSTARRQFRQYCAMTFYGYQRARRMGMALMQIRTSGDVVQAQLDSGFESESGFRAAFERLFGTVPSSAGSVTVLTSEWIATPIGAMLAIVDERGLHLLDFVTRRALEREIGWLRTHYDAVIVPGRHRYLVQLRRELDEYFAGTRARFDVPVVLAGAPFEVRVWQELLTIPSGETRSYGTLATQLGRSGASRAVGRANGANRMSIVVPCHRVIGADGSLTGYGGGLARKRWLLDHEAVMHKFSGA